MNLAASESRPIGCRRHWPRLARQPDLRSGRAALRRRQVTGLNPSAEVQSQKETKRTKEQEAGTSRPERFWAPWILEETARPSFALLPSVNPTLVLGLKVLPPSFLFLSGQHQSLSLGFTANPTRKAYASACRRFRGPASTPPPVANARGRCGVQPPISTLRRFPVYFGLFQSTLVYSSGVILPGWQISFRFRPVLRATHFPRWGETPSSPASLRHVAGRSPSAPSHPSRDIWNPVSQPRIVNLHSPKFQISVTCGHLRSHWVMSRGVFLADWRPSLRFNGSSHAG
jgi:hypothetical protein